MLKLKITKNRAARQLEPKVLSSMKRSLAEQLAGFRGTRSNDEQGIKVQSSKKELERAPSSNP